VCAAPSESVWLTSAATRPSIILQALQKATDTHSKKGQTKGREDSYDHSFTLSLVHSRR
jgi:hypothetical protein